MSNYDQINPASNVARIRAIDDDGCRLYLEFPNGVVTTVVNDEPFEFSVGSVVLVRINENYIELAPDELWPEQSFVGVVRLKLPDTTVVDVGGRWIMLPTNNVVYSEGNTVEAKNSSGVTRVLAKDPIKYLDLPAIDDATISSFNLAKGAIKDTFDDFGGLQDVVERARKLIEVPLKHKDALAHIGTRPIKGVLFTGQPGTGKTMLARIIANSTKSTFYEISGPAIFSKWYGQSEELLRKLFADAAQQEQAIIFFDEIDSVAGQRADESHEVSRRVVAQLLTLMDGFTKNNVVVIATSNRPQDIDAALRRPGRFDWEINFPLPNRQDRELILQASAKRLTISGNLPHAWVAQNTEAWSAADLAAIWTEAGLLAAADNRSVILAEDYVGGFELVSAQKHRTVKLSMKGSTK
ncbi:MAG: ATP-binding protein [Chloroflexota bacterium]